MIGKISEYDVVRKLGDGSTCDVMLGVHSQTGSQVAIKILHHTMSHPDVGIVQAEIHSLSTLNHHPNIITLHQYHTSTFM